MEFKDNRGKRIVFVGHCLLNQNARFPGIAVKRGAFNEFAGKLIEQGIGVEQLPCLECMGWGGVARKTYYQFQPLMLRHIDKKTFPVIHFFYTLWLHRFKWLCKREAQKVVSKIEDYRHSGYDVLGIVASNDSPTCGVTRTIDMIESVQKFHSLGFKKEELAAPDLERMRTVIPSLCTDGAGLFMGPVMAALKKRRMDVNVVGFEPWSPSAAEEAERVAKILNI